MMRLVAIAIAISSSPAAAQTLREFPKCLTIKDAKGGSICAIASPMSLGGGIANGGGGTGSGGGIGSGTGSGGAGTQQNVDPTAAALPVETEGNLAITRDYPSNLRFDTMKQLQNFKNLPTRP